MFLRDESVITNSLFNTENPFKKHSGTLEATEFIKYAFPEKYINAELIEINDSNLTNIYFELFSSLSSQLPTNVKFFSKYEIDKMFESRGELKPYYDARIETHFALEWREKDMFTIGREHYDSSTTYIMEKTGANIGFFPFLYKLDKAGEEDMYSYTIVCKQINWDTGGMSPARSACGGESAMKRPTPQRDESAGALTRSVPSNWCRSVPWRR
mgnify:CR=1 FL=1